MHALDDARDAAVNLHARISATKIFDAGDLLEVLDAYEAEIAKENSVLPTKRLVELLARTLADVGHQPGNDAHAVMEARWPTFVPAAEAMLLHLVETE